MDFQDAAKTGLLFGDETLTEEAEKERLQELSVEFDPLLQWLKKETEGLVREGECWLSSRASASY